MGAADASHQAAGGPAKENRGSARTRLLDAAEELFVEQGLAATSTRAITERAGTSAGALFYHFPNKDALIEAVLTERSSASQVAEILANYPHDPRAGLIGFADHLLEVVEAERATLTLIIRGEGAVTKDRLQELLHTTVEEIAAYLRRSLPDLHLEEARTISSMFISSVVVLELLTPSPDPPARARQVVDVLLHGR